MSARVQRTDKLTGIHPDDDGTKYRITANIEVEGVVERTDVVGAIYGQTEGLLGSELDLRTLQRASKVSRLDVSIESDAGRSVGTVTIDSRLDKPETAILAAALETIDQIGPCRGSIEVASIDDVRTATRREVADRAKEFLSEGFDDGLDPSDLLSEVKQSARRESLTTYEGLPAGPRVATSDSLVIVEGRADVRRLLECGLKNAIATEGTDVPDAVATLSHDRTTTVFVDGDRGGELLAEELRQVGAIDFVAQAPDGNSVEDLDRSAVFKTLREKVPADAAPENTGKSEPTAAGSTADSDSFEATADGSPAEQATSESEATTSQSAPNASNDVQEAETASAARTIAEHADAALRDDAARLLDADEDLIESVQTDAIAEAVLEADRTPATVVLPGTLSQELLDRLADHGVTRIVAEETGDFVKQPTSVRLTRMDELDLLEA